MMESKKRRKKGIALQRNVRRKRKKIRVLLFFIHIPYIKFQDPISNCALPNAMCDPRMHWRTHARIDGPNQYASSIL